MKRYLEIPYPATDNDSLPFAIAHPCARADVWLFDLLREKLWNAWLAAKGDTAAVMESHWYLIEKIAGLLRSDRHFPLDISRLKSDPVAIQELFIATLNPDGTLCASKLLNLHLYQPRTRPARLQDAPITIADVPFPSSGDTDMDSFANFALAFGVESAWWLLHHLDSESLDNFLHVHNELSRPADERVQEYVAKLFAQRMDAIDYQQSMVSDW